MTVREMIAKLSVCEPDAVLVSASDAESDEYHLEFYLVEGVSAGRVLPRNPADSSCELAHDGRGQAAVVVWPARG